MPPRLSASLLSLLSIVAAPLLAQNAETINSYCVSDIGGPAVYFSQAFDTGLKAGPRNDMGPIAQEFLQYLKGRFGYTSNSNYPVSCAEGASPAGIGADRARLEGQVRQQQKQAVEVDWKFVIDTAAAMASARTGSQKIPAAPPPDHGVCVSDVFTAPQYVSSEFDAVAPVAVYQWVQAWSKFLGDKYGAKGAVQCYLVSLGQAGRIAKARIDGARAGNRNAVETGWKYSAAAASVAAAPPAPADEPTAAPNEAQAALIYCRQHPPLATVFACPRVQHAVQAYRAAHSGDATPLADLFTGDKLNCGDCVEDIRAAGWARHQAIAQQLKGKAAVCTSEQFVAKLHAKPYPNRIQEDLDAAVAACKRS